MHSTFDQNQKSVSEFQRKMNQKDVSYHKIAYFIEIHLCKFYWQLNRLGFSILDFCYFRSFDFLSMGNPKTRENIGKVCYGKFNKHFFKKSLPRIFENARKINSCFFLGFLMPHFGRGCPARGSVLAEPFLWTLMNFGSFFVARQLL